MRRELRRHPVQTKPARGSNRPVRMPRAAPTRPGGATPAAGRVRGLPGFLQPAWFKEIWGELKKVQWPTRQEAINLTMVVLVVSAALGLFLGGVDAAFNWLIEHTLLA
jgi:preprotein translocase SecE subunit